MKKRFVISEIFICILAVIAILIGVFYSSIASLFIKGVEPTILTDADVGKTFTFECIDNFIEADENSYLFDYGHEDGAGAFYYVKTPPNLCKRLELQCRKMIGTYEGKFQKADDDIRDIAISKLDEYYFKVSEISDKFEYTKEMQQEARESITDYYIEVVSINEDTSTVPRFIAYAIGAVLLLTFCIRIIAFGTQKPAWKIAVVFSGTVLIITTVLFSITFNKVRTMASVKNEDVGLYSMTFYGELKLDKLLSSDISTIEDFMKWIMKEQFYGFPITVDEDNFGCATFVCRNPDGDILMGRNFDYNDTDTVVIHTEPKGGYASYSLADLTVLGLGDYDIMPGSLRGRAYMMATPYMCLDGVNEAGLAVAILELETKELHQDNGKPDILIYPAIRVLLDKCANVDEAITLLNNYDMHTSIGVSYHLQIADKTGRAVVVEWLDGEMIVNEMCSATNSVLAPGNHFDEGDADNRNLTIMKTLENHNYVLSEDEARDLLETVSRNGFTEWSCVYNLNRFKVDVYMDTDYRTVYSFGEE